MSNRSPDMDLRQNRASSPGAANSSTTDHQWLQSSSSSISYSSDMTCQVSSFQLPTKAKESSPQHTNAPLILIKAMPLVGCPRCLMYVMLSEEDPKCPMCKSTSFLYFLAYQEENSKKTETTEVSRVQE